MPEPLNPCHPEHRNSPQCAGDTGCYDVAALGRKLFDLRIKCLELDLDWKTVDFAAKAISFLESRHTEMQRTSNEQILAYRTREQELESQLAEAKGALVAQDNMQNAQLNAHRDIEILALPEHIVASSDIVADLCDHFYGLLCTAQQQLAEAQQKYKTFKRLVEISAGSSWDIEVVWPTDADDRTMFRVDTLSDGSPDPDENVFVALVNAVKYDQAHDQNAEFIDDEFLAAIEAASKEGK